MKPIYLHWCNECDWEQEENGQLYDFCEQCGHINIGRKCLNFKEYLEYMESKEEK